MAVKFKSSTRRKARPHVLQKPRGVVHPRVQAVGPEHFAFLCVDCAKARSKIMLADFYGRVVIEPTTIAHDRFSLDAAVRGVRDAMAQHNLKDVVVVVERTGRYHQVVQRTFTKAGFEVRIVHPFATKQFRQPANPGNKTDDTDLSAIHRAAVSGFGLSEQKPDPLHVRLQLLARHRRSLVRKKVAIQLKMLEHLEACMPGYSQCVSDLFDSEVAMWVAKNLGSAEAIVNAGVMELVRRLSQADLRKNTPVVEKIVAWARSAPPADEPAPLHHRFYVELDEDRVSKLRSIHALEAELAQQLALTPYVLLLAIPGISVVSTAEFVGEAGPMEHYRTARAISGRAGLCPSWYQSDQVDRCDGKLIRCANRDLRYALTIIADNLLRGNEHFRILAASWRLKGKDPRDIHIKVAGRFSRIAYQVAAGRQVFRHPCARQRDYILEKLIAFGADHEIPAEQLKRILDAATDQLPPAACQEEAIPLVEKLARVRKRRGAGPQSLGEILPSSEEYDFHRTPATTQVSLP
ncbi:MAG: IS110 family transposase [Isosphaeraceae bacterium]